MKFARGIDQRCGGGQRPALAMVVLGVLVMSGAGCGNGTADTSIKALPRELHAAEQPTSWKQEAQHFFVKGDRDGTIAVYDRVIRLQPGNVDALVARGQLLIQLGKERFDEGVADIDRALSISPNDPDVLGAKAEAMRLRGDVDGALRLLDHAVELAPSSGAAFYNRGLMYFRQKASEKALADLTKAIELAPRDFRVYEARGSVRLSSREFEEAISDFNTALTLQPNSPYSLDGRSTALRGLKQFDLALDDLDELLRLFPGSSAAYAVRAETNIRSGDYESGIDDLLAAINLTLDDAGMHYAPTTGRELSSEAVRHGENQVKAMLRDRPEMARHVTEDDELWTWAVRKFAGEDVDEEFVWDPTRPNCAALHFQPYDGAPGRIQISPISWKAGYKGDKAQFEDLWSSAVFELHNIALGEGFKHVRRDRDAGNMTRKEYVKAIIEIERRAAQRTRAFYAKVFLPWAIENGFRNSNPSFWYIHSGKADWAEQWRPGHENWEYYAMQYDLSQAKRAYQAGDYVAALSILDSVLSQNLALDNIQLSDAYRILAMCQIQRGERTKAQESLDRAIQFDPNSVNALMGRAFLNMDSPKKALTDLDRVIELAPAYATAYQYRGLGRRKTGDLEGALDDFSRLLQLEPRNPQAYKYRGEVWLLNANLDNALADFNEALRLDPKDSNALCARADLYLGSLNEPEMALVDFDAAIAAEPINDRAFLSRGRAHEAMSNYQMALADYDRAIRISPKTGTGYYLRARLLLCCPNTNIRDTRRAIRDANRACELTNWQSLEYLSFLAEAYAKVGDYDAALQWQSKALEFATGDVKARYQRKLNDYREKLMADVMPSPN